MKMRENGHCIKCHRFYYPDLHDGCPHCDLYVMLPKSVFIHKGLTDLLEPSLRAALYGQLGMAPLDIDKIKQLHDALAEDAKKGRERIDQRDIDFVIYDSLKGGLPDGPDAQT